MPAFNPYNTSGLTTGVYTGGTFALWNAETPAEGTSSIVVAPQGTGNIARGFLGWTIDFAGSPTAVVEIFGSNTYPTSGAGGTPENGTLVYTSTDTQHDNYIDNSAFAFYWSELVSRSGGGALTVLMHVN